MAILLDARLRYGEICRRLVPADRKPEEDGPWKAGFTDEVDRLRDWRLRELIRLAGADAAEKIGRHSQRILGF